MRKRVVVRFLDEKVRIRYSLHAARTLGASQTKYSNITLHII
jgi:hypothetical protein